MYSFLGNAADENARRGCSFSSDDDVDFEVVVVDVDVDDDDDPANDADDPRGDASDLVMYLSAVLLLLLLEAA